MQRPILLVALLIGLCAPAMSAAAHQPRPDPAGPALADVGILPGPDHPGSWRLTPWHYHPYQDCPPPWCLPSYHRHRGVLADPRALPLVAVLERLKGQDFDGFSSALLEGANYNIIARNRYGQAVRLIVNAGNGQIRRILQ